MSADDTRSLELSAYRYSRPNFRAAVLFGIKNNASEGRLRQNSGCGITVYYDFCNNYVPPAHGPSRLEGQGRRADDTDFQS